MRGGLCLRSFQPLNVRVIGSLFTRPLRKRTVMIYTYYHLVVQLYKPNRNEIHNFEDEVNNQPNGCYIYVSNNN